MAKPIQDDFSGALLDAENDTIYGITVTKRDVDSDGNRRLMKLEFDVGHESATELIFSKFEGKKVLRNWQTYVPPSKDEKAKGTKGTWIKAKK